ncbi:hypothetical protein EWF20_06755 [Sulfolobus sp. S-194]|uniref:hypothetical protein n=1 Tax=Sulfolobus sp. S-194 TaxID=2512240 RepID=UPI0014373080|nr:hypothetical protein [Sulfolobus sp. S-194]QIW23880.1 hypothetical protein EWF20_06755 [Sulfolobus sp. S-194]
MHKVFKYILINRFYLPRNIRAIIIITFFILLLPTEYIIGNLGIITANVLASSSSTNLPSYIEPINYVLSVLHVIVSKEYISSFSTSNYSGYVVSNANGWVVMNNTNYTFTYFGKACYNNYTFNTIQLINVTYDGDILIKIIYNITLINIPKSNGIDSVAKITRTYVIIRGIEPESETTTTQFYWFNYTKTLVGNNEYNISFNSNIEGIKAKGYVVEDPNSNSITLASGVLNVVGDNANTKATVNNNEITIYTNTSNDPVTINVDPVEFKCSYSWGYVKGVLIETNVPDATVNNVNWLIDEVVSLLFSSGGLVAKIIAAYIMYYSYQYDQLVNEYSYNGVATLYYMEAASHKKVTFLFWSKCIVSGIYAETGVYYNGEYYPFTNSYTLMLAPNYNFGYFLYEQPHSSILPPPPYSPPWYGFWDLW